MPIPAPATVSRKRRELLTIGGICGFFCEISMMTINAIVAIFPLSGMLKIMQTISRTNTVMMSPSTEKVENNHLTT